MSKARSWRTWLFVGLAYLGGCSKQDAERLSRIAHRSGEKLDRLTGGMRNKVSSGWQAARGSLGEATLDSRVSTRIKWDKTLANTDVQVKTTGPGVVELKGTLTNEEQRRHALELANSTDGVASVTDSLEVTGQ
jgi:osmotically-inducible protein OsmY